MICLIQSEYNYAKLSSYNIQGTPAFKDFSSIEAIFPVPKERLFLYNGESVYHVFYPQERNSIGQVVTIPSFIERWFEQSEDKMILFTDNPPKCFGTETRLFVNTYKQARFRKQEAFLVVCRNPINPDKLVYYKALGETDSFANIVLESELSTMWFGTKNDFFNEVVASLYWTRAGRYSGILENKVNQESDNKTRPCTLLYLNTRLGGDK